MASMSFTGVILAGGASRRMGTDKATLTAPNGEPLLTLIKSRLLEAGAQKIVILGRPDEAGGIADKHPFSGPVQAITDYLEGQALRSQHLVVPVDMPNLTTQLLQSLARTGKWASFEEQYMPFLAISGTATPKHIRRIGTLLSYHNADVLPIPRNQSQAFINLNHPQEYSRWQVKHPQPSNISHSNQGPQHHV